MSLKGAKLIDFTGTVPGSESHEGFGEAVVKSLRGSWDNKTVVVIDRGFGFSQPSPHIVKDHLNLTGTVPLVGPNDTCGERFPVVNEIYLTEFAGQALPKLPSGIAAGLKDGVKPSPEEEAHVHALGANFFCYNLIPTMIVAAHAGWKVVGILVPDNTKLDGDLIAELQA